MIYWYISIHSRPTSSSCQRSLAPAVDVIRLWLVSVRHWDRNDGGELSVEMKWRWCNRYPNNKQATAVEWKWHHWSSEKAGNSELLLSCLWSCSRVAGEVASTRSRTQDIPLQSIRVVVALSPPIGGSPVWPSSLGRECLFSQVTSTSRRLLHGKCDQMPFVGQWLGD